jgi:predicted transglutaminase-like cysteine proteinase
MRPVLVGLSMLMALHNAPSMAQPSAGQDKSTAFMRVFGPTDPPYAFWRFCEEFPVDCARRRVVDGRFDAKAARLKELADVNTSVNQAIEPVTDLELYGVSDYWTLPRNGKGDCEDYALLKRHVLIEAGWPASSLLMTVVLDEKNDGHAVLTARTVQGDFILDNKTDEIKLWHATPYRFVMRQSYIDPKSWVALDPAQSAPPVAIAGVDKE